jgi:Skp family chaperone for outer membrane proteins
MTGMRFAAGRVLAALVVLTGLSGPVAAQEVPLAPGTVASEVVTLDQDRLYTGSRYGQQILADLDRQLKELQAENRRIESGLEAEERDLTERRATLSPEEFRALADAFDAKVKDIRTARDAKARDIGLQRDLAQQTFLEAAVPILAQIMTERGASVIINRDAVILSFDRIDITDEAIARIDAQLDARDAASGPDAAPTAETGDQAAPEATVPATDPASGTEPQGAAQAPAAEGPAAPSGAEPDPAD